MLKYDFFISTNLTASIVDYRRIRHDDLSRVGCVLCLVLHFHPDDNFFGTANDKLLLIPEINDGMSVQEVKPSDKPLFSSYDFSTHSSRSLMRILTIHQWGKQVSFQGLSSSEDREKIDSGNEVAGDLSPNPQDKHWMKCYVITISKNSPVAKFHFSFDR